MARAVTSAGFLALALGLFCAASSTSAGEHGFQVIVHPDNPVLAVDREFLRAAYLKTALRWSHRAHVLRPIDLPRDAPARARFTRDVLEKTPAQLRNFWVQRIFSGTAVPPPEADSAAAAVAYVLAHPGGLGYVPIAVDIGRARRVAVE